MAVINLSSDETIEAIAKAPKRAKGISELLYFPKVVKDLKGDSDESAQEMWALKGKALEVFKEKIKKYDETAANLAEAQKKLAGASEASEIESAQKEVFTAQEAMRELIVEESGQNDKDDLNPLPKHGAKALIECVGFVNKRTYYISKRDLKKVEDINGKKKFRFETNLMKKLENEFALSLEVARTDSKKGESAKNLKTEFMKFKADIAKEWKFGEGKTAGQLKASSIEKYVGDGKIKEFFESIGGPEKCELIDESIKFFNDNTNVSYQKYEDKKKEILDALTPPKKEKSTRKSRRNPKTNNKEDKKEHKFGQYEWGRIILRTQEIWNKTDSDFVQEIQTTDYPKTLESRADLLEKFKAKELPEVIFDASAGAQIMRYSANCGGAAKFDFTNANISANYEAGSKLSLFEAGADFNVSYPSQSGLPFKFKAPVYLERFERELIQQGTNENIPDPLFPSASSLPLPSTTLTAARQLTSSSKFTQYTHSEGQEILIQVVGHTDAVGSAKDNMKLSQERAANMYALLTSDQTQLTQNFQSGVWGDAERDMMLLSSYMMTKHPKAFKERFGDMKMKDKDDLKDILKREFVVATKQYGYPVSSIISDDLKPDSESKTDSKSEPKPFLDGLNETVIPAIPDEPTADEPTPTDSEITKEYLSNTTNFLFSTVKGLKMNFSERLYVDSDLHPIIGQGESDLKEEVYTDNAKNRRISFNLYGITKLKDKEEGFKEIDLGYGRIRVHGQVTAFVGASLALAGAVELNTYNGAALLVAKKSKDDKDGELTPYSEDNPNETVKAEVNARAFVGAEAQAALSAALEWGKTNTDFKLLASIGGSISGTAGAGIDGEFKIGFDQRTGTFQIKMKAQATWGLGGGGSWCLAVGVQQLYDFVILIFEKLSESDFNFLDIFENKLNEKGIPTESEQDVYQLYTAWVIELWQQEDYATAIVAAQAGVVATSWFTILTYVQDNLNKLHEAEVNSDKAQTLINNVLEDPSLLQYSPPKVKGRMLYMITEYPGFFAKSWTNSTLTDHNVKAETAALKVILSVNHAREFKEMMEHILPEAQRAKKAIDIIPQSKRYLKDNLLSDYEKWIQVENKSAELEHKDKAWNSQFIKYKDHKI